MDVTAQVSLGDTELKVSRLGLGTGPLAGSIPIPDSLAIASIRRAVTAGIRLFDSAPLYYQGVSEARLGRVLGGVPRDQYVVSTKVGRALERPKGLPPGASSESRVVFDFSYEATHRSLEESLARLGLDQVDILYIHDPDDFYQTAVHGALRALREMRRAGTVRAIGSAMTQAEMLQQFATRCDIDCVLVAGRYTLLDQQALDSLLPTCLERGVGVVVGGVYNSGILARPGAGATFDYRPAPPPTVERVEEIGKVCADHAVPLKAAALQFPYGHPAVCSVLTGVRSPDELDENLAMLAIDIPTSFWMALRRKGLIPLTAPIPDVGG
jgi:D-threo-aldose 1-dehydrogenase